MRINSFNKGAERKFSQVSFLSFNLRWFIMKSRFLGSDLGQTFLGWIIIADDLNSLIFHL